MNRLLVASLSSSFFISQAFPVLADERPFVPRYTTVTRTTEARTTTDYPERSGYRRNHDADNGGGSGSGNQQPPAPNTGNATVPILAGVAGLAIGALLFGHHGGGGGNSGGNTTTTNSNNTTIVTTNNINTNTAVTNHNGYQSDQADSQPQQVQYQPPPQQHQWSRNTLPVTEATPPPAYLVSPELPATGGPFVARNGDAPADEYFGSMNMSVLGIRNSINDTNKRAVGAGEETGHVLLHMLLFTEQAFRDWQRKYPNDTWIVTNGYEMVDDFQKLDVETPDENPHQASIHAIDLENWLDATYPGNQYASK